MLDKPSKSSHPSREIKEAFDLAANILETNLEKAKELLEENIKAGCTDSMVMLGTILCDGTEGEKARSIELFRRAADMGDSSGLRNLGYCYAIGLNIEKDKTEGARLYTLAANAGNARAACNIGVMYDYGNGVPQDFLKAFEWYRKSAAGGCTRGMTNLGEYYLVGKATPKDVGSAIQWFERSGSPRACFRLGMIYLTEKGYADPGKAQACLKKSAESGYTKGMFEYAKLIEDTDRETSIAYYEEAASKGNKDAEARLIELGLPVPEPIPRKKKRST